MNIRKDLIVEGAAGRSFLLDVYLPDGARGCPVVVFAHGFKGFKDWGCWHLVARRFAEAGFAFVKFNFSHNGTTTDQPSDFADLEAFGQNNFSKELKDLDAVLTWIHHSGSWPTPSTVDLRRVALIGHSRGGGTGIIKAMNDERIHALLTWASVAQLDYAWRNQPEHVEHWKKEGVIHILNGRTRQMMPLGYQLYLDFEAHASQLSIELALQKRPDLPVLFVHGSADPTIPAALAQQLKAWRPGAEVALIEGADHVFGVSHPFADDAPLPVHTDEVVRRSIDFLNAALVV